MLAQQSQHARVCSGAWRCTSLDVAFNRLLKTEQLVGRDILFYDAFRPLNRCSSIDALTDEIRQRDEGHGERCVTANRFEALQCRRWYARVQRGCGCDELGLRCGSAERFARA